METSLEKRKLAAVMFADIEGYTALFQKNEAGAFTLVEQHRKDLRDVALKHKGHIVKYYGDGSLTLFPSVIEAARCAIELQAISVQHQIPLRIGMHMGEMIEKDKDVYGDAVNVASRIQAIGTSGSILVSITVEEELKNHPHITTKSLGKVYLKNVKNAVEVFAVTTPGLTIPHDLSGAKSKKIKRASFFILPVIIIGAAAFILKDEIKARLNPFGEECVIIPPFISHDPLPELAHFGTMASFELIKAMSESAKGNVIPYNTMLLYTNANIGSFSENPSLSKKLGAQIEVRGKYTLEGLNRDTLRVSISILDLDKNRLLQTPIPDVTCPSANKRECLDEIKNILVGYWKSKEDYLFHSTTDSAYIPFLIAKNKWADPTNKDEIKSYLLKSIQEDPKFMDAWFLLLSLFHNNEDYKSGLDTIRVMEKLIPDMDQRQQEYLGFYKADFQRNNQRAFKAFLTEYEQNKRDLFVNTTGMIMAMEYLNDPLTTIKMFNEIEPDSLKLSTCIYCFSRFNTALKAYIALFDLEKARHLAEEMKPFALKTTHFIGLLKFYVSDKDTVSINEVIRAGAKASSHADEEAYLNMTTARLASVTGNIAMRNTYASKAIRLYEKKPAINLGRCYQLIGRYTDAKQIYLAELGKDDSDPSIYANLGIIYAKLGDTKSANQMIENLDRLKEEFDLGYTPYYQGRIKANMGEYNSALDYLKIALEEGIRFLPTSTFLNDPDMIVMNSNKEYLALLARNRL